MHMVIPFFVSHLFSLSIFCNVPVPFLESVISLSISDDIDILAVYIYIYIYICVCVCVPAFLCIITVPKPGLSRKNNG